MLDNRVFLCYYIACSRAIAFDRFGVYNIEVPPVPIPNTVVKLNCAEDTWREAARENRSSPEQKMQTSNSLSVFLFHPLLCNGM